jgi:hypothetical protein
MFLKEHCGKLGMNEGAAGVFFCSIWHTSPLLALRFGFSVPSLCRNLGDCWSYAPLVTKLIPLEPLFVVPDLWLAVA